MSNSSHPSLTLVFSSYEATNWIVKLPEAVTVAHVVLVSNMFSPFTRLKVGILLNTGVRVKIVLQMSYYQSFSNVRVLHLPRGAELTNYELHVPEKSHMYMDYKVWFPNGLRNALSVSINWQNNVFI